MATRSIIGQLILGCLCLWLSGCDLFKKKTEDPKPLVCNLLSTAYKLDNNGTLTNQISRTLGYTGTKLTSITEQNTDRQINLTVQYGADSLATKATDNQFVITFETNKTTRKITRATTAKSAVTQSVFDLTYDAAGRLTRLLETRQVRPANSQTKTLSYLFTYNSSGTMLVEKARYTLIDDSFVEQETAYTHDDGLSAYAHLADPALLAIVALSQQVETLPGRFWHPNALKSFQTYNLSATGARTTLRDSATFTNTFNSNLQLASQVQNTLSYFTNPTSPIIRKNQYAFTYLCK